MPNNREYHRQYWKVNRERLLLQKKIHRRKYREQILSRNRTYRQEHKEEISEKAIALRHKRREELRIFLNKEKVLRGGKCGLCGYNKDLRALVWHHSEPDNKKYSISNMLSGGLSIKLGEIEINKCTLICANCHTILEHDE